MNPRAQKATLATAAVVAWLAAIVLIPPGLLMLLIAWGPGIVGLWFVFYKHWFRETK